MPSFTKGFNFGPKVCYASTIRKLFTLLYPFYFFAGNHCQTSRDTTTSGCSCRATRGRVSPPGRYGDFLDIYANVRHVRRYEDPRRRKSRVHPGSLALRAIARTVAPRQTGTANLESIPLVEISHGRVAARWRKLAIRSVAATDRFFPKKETGRGERVEGEEGYVIIQTKRIQFSGNICHLSPAAVPLSVTVHRNQETNFDPVSR